jgi:hypothetical protein
MWLILCGGWQLSVPVPVWSLPLPVGSAVRWPGSGNEMTHVMAGWLAVENEIAM